MAGRFVVVAMCFLWIVSPIDIVPEHFVGPIGYIDDLVAFVVLWKAAGGRVA